MHIPNPIILNSLLDKLFGEGFVTWEPETLEIELLKLKHPTLSKYGKDTLVTNMINAIRALRSDKSYAQEEWHYLEKLIAALTGKEVLFFDAQPPSSFHEVFLGVEVMIGILTSSGKELELSEETKFYLGLVLIGLGIFYFPFEPYKTIIEFTIENHSCAKITSMGETVAAFKEKMDKLLANKDYIATIMKAAEENPDTDILASVKNVDLFNAITSVIAYLTIKEELNTKVPAAEAISDTTESIKESSPSEDISSLESEGIESDAMTQVLDLIDGENGISEKEASRRKHPRKIPRAGSYIISEDPDEFNTEHKYEAGQAGSGANVISSQDGGNEFNSSQPGNMKVIDIADIKTDTEDKISKLFGDLDF